MSVVLINAFEVPPHIPEEQFLAGWERAADLLRSRPGFIGLRLHRSLSPDARFRFVNVAEWESPQHFQAAVTDSASAELEELTAPPRSTTSFARSDRRRDSAAAFAATSKGPQPLSHSAARQDSSSP